MSNNLAELTARIEIAVDELADEATQLLSDLIAFPSLAGTEADIQKFLANKLQHYGLSTELVAVDAGIEDDPNYSHHSGDGQHAPNLLTFLPSKATGRSLLLNSHTDIVPTMEEGLFRAKLQDGRVIGRGACDAKGQIVTWVLAMLAVKEAGITLEGECVGAAVVEEEIGGNGTLALVRNIQNPCDVAVVLEPTQYAIHPANRGALWFRIQVQGTSTHMGRWWEGQSAFENLETVLREIRLWDSQIVEESHGVPLFPDNPSPVHVNIGIVRAGDWPATVPATAVCEGGVSFLPNKTLLEIKHGLTQAVARATQETGIKATVTFEKLQNEAYAIPADHPAVESLRQATIGVRGEAEVTGFLASCDARLLFHRANMPTIVFGPGDLLLAHSDIESIAVAEIVTGAKILGRFILDWCGGSA